MGDSVDEILEFLRRNKFARAEAAFRGELGSRPDSEKEKGEVRGRSVAMKQSSSSGARSEDTSNELVVKEVEVGSVRNRYDSKTNASVDLYPWAETASSKESAMISESFSALSLSARPSHQSINNASNSRDSSVQTNMEDTASARSGANAGVAIYADDLSDNLWAECSVKTVFPFPKGIASSSRDLPPRAGDGKKDKRNVLELDSSAIEFIEDAVELTSPNGNSHESLEQRRAEGHKEELPRLPPVRLKSEERPLNLHWEEKAYHHTSEGKLASADGSFLIGSFLDVPIGQDLSSTGGKRALGNSWLSVSQGIAEDAELVSGFNTVGDESAEYPNEFWDSDEYDDDEDVGYTRQPIEDETWFLAHEIDYPSDNEKGHEQGSTPDQQTGVQAKDDDDDQSFGEDSYFSGELYFQGNKKADGAGSSREPVAPSTAADYDGQLMDVEELNLMRREPVWKGFVSQPDDLVLNESETHLPGIYCVDDDLHGSVRSIGVGISSDAADIGSEVRESLLEGNSEGDVEFLHDDYTEKARKQNIRGIKGNSDKYVVGPTGDGGFSFAPPIRVDEALLVESNSEEVESDYCNGFIGNDDMLGTWRPKRNDSHLRGGSGTSTASSVSRNQFRDDIERENDDQSDGRQEDPGAALEDEEAAAVQEQIRQIRSQEDEFETFNLKIVHRKNRTGFEEEKNFQVVLNSVLAGRYHVTEYLGSAAFSKAIQAHDLHTGMDVCVKIIKNNKDFFDQSLDEIKLLKFVNKHDPADKYHILRLYDYFYYREHLLIVCELLKANLYEFHKFNRESGGEVYFTMPRLQSITIQCLEALEFLHGLGLIHCDLKPENILIKSYSRCQVKVIDLGSSCFETDHLCSYVQSRSYRAPEVILGLPYDKKIDIWSLGCILAELCTGNVLLQNDSPATLLARVIGIIGSIEPIMLAKGRDTHKYFTKGHMLYERNPETNRLEYLIPKKTSLRHRLPMGDEGFISFVAHLLEINPKKRPSASEALKHPWLSHPYDPISS
ncbi:uncharacterized protein LOC144704108 [Wolffia australiana]